jgi:hypothetical protein
MVLVDGTGLPLAVDVESASLSEVNLIEPLLDQAVTPYVPPRLIYDRAANSDPLRQRLTRRNIEPICRIAGAAFDRPLRRYRKRWIVERTIAWPQSFMRLVPRYEFLFVSLSLLRHARVSIRSC